MTVEAKKHVHSVKTYYYVFGALAILTVLTAVAAFVDLSGVETFVGFQPGAFNAPIALAIAVFKATLVVLFFMHVKDSSRLTWITVMSAVFWLLILLFLSMTDYLTRSWA